MLLVRHTSVDIRGGTCYGQLDVDVASSFEKEKQMIENDLAGKSFDAVYSSPLQRCAKLAGELCRGHEVVYDRRIMELNFGQWEGLRWDDIYKMPGSRAWFKDYNNMPCPGGESHVDMGQRVAAFYVDMLRQHPGGNVLIVTHAGVIRLLYAIATRRPFHEVFTLNVKYGDVIEV